MFFSGNHFYCVILYTDIFRQRNNVLDKIINCSQYLSNLLHKNRSNFDENPLFTIQWFISLSCILMSFFYLDFKHVAMLYLNNLHWCRYGCLTIRNTLKYKMEHLFFFQMTASVNSAFWLAGRCKKNNFTVILMTFILHIYDPVMFYFVMKTRTLASNICMCLYGSV